MQVLSGLIFQCSLLLYLVPRTQWILAPWKLQEVRRAVSHERFCFCFSGGGGQNQKLMCLWAAAPQQPSQRLVPAWLLCSALCCPHGCALRHAPSWTCLQLYQKTRSCGPEGNCHRLVKRVVILRGASLSTVSLSGNIHGPFDDSLLKLRIPERTSAPFHEGNT